MSVYPHDRMVRVTPAAPCPICGKGDWCLVAPDGTAAICQRVESDKRAGDAGWLHRLDEPTPPPRPAPTRNGTHPPYIDWPARARGYAAQLTDEAGRELADALGLPVEALAVIQVGYDLDEDCWTFPEYDGTRRVVGITRRFRDPAKKKKMYFGGHRGLTLTRGCLGGEGPLLLPEGPSDVLALRQCGLAAVGRPSNLGGIDEAAEYLKDFPKDRRLVVVGENDQKPDGKWPGRYGAEKTAAALSAKLGRKVDVALPPDGAKDVRVWVLDQVAGSAEAVDWHAIGRELLDRLEPVTAGAPPSDPPATTATTPAGDRPDVALSDVGNANQFVAEHGENVRYVDAWGRWYIWDGSRWARDQTRAVEELAKRNAVRRVAEAAAELADATRAQDAARIDDAEARLKWARKSLADRAIQSTLNLARSDPAVALTPAAFDTDPWLLNCPSGTVDLRTGDLRPHRRGDYVTRLCPVRYDPAARCPTWERFLEPVFGSDADLIGFIRRLLGYCLTGDTREHVLVVFWGDGSNGKSTFVEIVMVVLGEDYAGKADPALLLTSRSEAHPTGKADLRGKRLVVANETADGRRLDEATVKELTGGDTVKARFMRQDFFQFAPTHKLLLATNYKPEVRGTDAGIWRRLRLVPFTARFWSPDEPALPGEDRPAHLRADKDMKDKLLAEREGILAWMVRGCREWVQAAGLGMPAAVAAATTEYRQQEDIFGRFIRERCERHPELRVRAGELYAAFKVWCLDVNGMEKVPSQRWFGLSMSRAKFERKDSNGAWYVGLRLTDSEV